MEEEKSLEKEFEFFKQIHMINICKQVLEDNLKAEIDKTVNIPTFLLKEQIEEEVKTKISRAIQKGTFNTLYEESWEKVKHEVM